jgi:hypothetical protein
MYIRIKENKIAQYPYSLLDFRAEFPNLSIPSEIPLNLQIELGVFKVKATPKPVSDTEEYIESDPVNNFGFWEQSWVARELSPIELAERIEKKWEQVRELRDQILEETDQTQLPDRPIDEDLRLAYADYRQSLRDITLQPDPFNIEWPERPE